MSNTAYNNKNRNNKQVEKKIMVKPVVSYLYIIL